MNDLYIYLTNLVYRYNKKRAYKCRITRTNSFFSNILPYWKLFGYLGTFSIFHQKCVSVLNS